MLDGRGPRLWHMVHEGKTEEEKAIVISLVFPLLPSSWSPSSMGVLKIASVDPVYRGPRLVFLNLLAQ